MMLKYILNIMLVLSMGYASTWIQHDQEKAKSIEKNPDERKKNKFPGKENELYIIKKIQNKKADNKKVEVLEL